MADLEHALQLIDENEGLSDFDGPKSVELIEQAQQALGLTFPPTYRLFVERLGCGDISGVEFCGVISNDFENSSIPDAIWLTLNERRNSGLPANLLLVAETGEGTYYAISTGKTNSEGDSPVVEWEPGNSSLVDVAEDFGAFMREKLDDVLS